MNVSDVTKAGPKVEVDRRREGMAVLAEYLGEPKWELQKGVCTPRKAWGKEYRKRVPTGKRFVSFQCHREASLCQCHRRARARHKIRSKGQRKECEGNMRTRMKN
jgi:hypothetical protein